MKPLLLCCPWEFFQVWYHFWNQQTISDNFCFGAISKIPKKFFRKFCLNWTCDPEIWNPARMSHNSESIGRTKNYDHSFPLEFWWLEDFVLPFKSNSQIWRVKSPKTMNFQSRLHRTWNHSCSAVPGNFFKCDTIFEISRRFQSTFVLGPYQKSRKKLFAHFASIGPVIQKFWIQPEGAITLKVFVPPKTMTTVFDLKFDD